MGREYLRYQMEETEYLEQDEIIPGHIHEDIHLDSMETQTQELEAECEDTENTAWPSGYYCGDGSGGKYSSYPTLTRCGVGVHYVTPDKIPQNDVATPSPGKIQTNNRAELYASG